MTRFSGDFGVFAWALKAACLSALVFVTSCATQDPVRLEPVGPGGKSASMEGGDGRLLVFSSTEVFSSGDVDYFHHSSYRITVPDGKLIQSVRNYTHDRDSHPELVTLPAGDYVILAKSARAGAVSVPVRVEPFKTTEIHLESGWKPDLNGGDPRDLVLLPTGHPIGWRAAGSDARIDEKKLRRSDVVVKVQLIQAPDTFGKVAYALVKPLAVLRSRGDQHFNGPFTVGFTNPAGGVAADTSIIYLKKVSLENGHKEWRLVED